MTPSTLLTTLLFLFLLSPPSLTNAVTDPNDLKILQQFRKGLDNPELLPWPDQGGDPCGNPPWKYIFCLNSRVNQIQAKGLNLTGPLPQNFNQLSMLSNLGLQNNRLNGPLPSFKGLSKLQFAFLDNNDFDSIPSDFFDGLESLEALALDHNNLNATTGGWRLPSSLQGSTQLTNFSCMSCNLVGPLPEFLGEMNSLSLLKLSNNNLTGEIPRSLNRSALQVLWLNNQQGERLSGTIDVVSTMVPLSSLWLHGNVFTGSIPENIGDLVSLKDFDLNGNRIVGLVPDALGNMQLDNLDLNNNMLMGPIPNFKASKFSYDNNDFCQSKPGVPCAFEVMALLGFLSGLNYPSNLVDSWKDNDPCGGNWLGIKCDVNGKVSMINLPKFKLNGTLSPSVANLGSLVEIRLGGNNISGGVPSNWTSLTSLKLLDLSDNNISPPLPEFRNGLKPVVVGNHLLDGSPEASSSGNNSPSTGSGNAEPAPAHSSSSDSYETKKSKGKSLAPIVAPIAGVTAAAFLLIPLYAYCFRRRKGGFQAPASLVIHPRDPSDSDNNVKIVVANNTTGSISTLTGSGSGSRNSSGIGESHVIEAGNLKISVQVLRNVTKNFAPENELGHGGFGVVYKGELADGTNIAVKRMEAGVISSKALDEFQAEIAVLSKVRHRHLVSLLGYSIEGNERILVYEYMPQGALSKHLFHWKSFGMEPLSWKRRLNIALDVARGMEYLHTLAHQSFIHRDLKSSNILLADDFRAKVSDFGLVKLAPEGEEKSVVTRLAGTFGYLAPEYAVTGKITTKADVFSFGVVLMELLTGLMALDDDRPEESQYLAAWFWHIKSDKKKLMAAIDPVLDVKEETFESISMIAELAGHCTAREPSQRPDMGHAVNVLAPLVEKWKPFDDDTEEYSGIDYSLPLNQMVKGWQEAEGKDLSYMDLEDSKSSIPARPTGFADSFTSIDGR
ncbi:hypothetical protein RJT34_19536 [Clitoria ternatea]|uniref:non-specific serine/threonine protein kinase n=1 Tax=Clitoria ternatea TaxID=43366 RepID=A0AAN9IR79_CLITE